MGLCVMLAASQGARAQSSGTRWVAFAPGCEMSAADISGARMALLWNGDAYESADTLTPGRGYLLVPANETAAPAAPACGVRAADTASVALQAGWNLLGNPYQEFRVLNPLPGMAPQNSTARIFAETGALRAAMAPSGRVAPGAVFWIYSPKEITLRLSELFSSRAVRDLRVITNRAAGDSADVLSVGKSLQMALSVTYEGGGVESLAADRAAWSVSDPALARVDSQGLVSALGAGEFTVTASLAGGSSATYSLRAASECDQVCVGMALNRSLFSDREKYEVFVKNLLARTPGAAPAQGCAFVVWEDRNGIVAEPVSLAAASLTTAPEYDMAAARAYCVQGYNSFDAGLVQAAVADPQTGGARAVWLKDVTAQAVWTWDNHEALTKVPDFSRTLNKNRSLGFTHLTATYKGLAAAPALVAVEKKRPVHLSLVARFEKDWTYIDCSKAGDDCVPNYRDRYKVVLEKGHEGRMTVEATYNTQVGWESASFVQWQAPDTGVVEMTGPGLFKGLAPGMAPVQVSYDGVQSEPFVIEVPQADIVSLLFEVRESRGCSTTTGGETVYSGPGGAAMTVLDAGGVVINLLTKNNLDRIQAVSNQAFGSGQARWTVSDARGVSREGLDFSGPGPWTVTAFYEGLSASVILAENSADMKIRLFATNFKGYGNMYYYVPYDIEKNGVFPIADPDEIILKLLRKPNAQTQFDATVCADWSITTGSGQVLKTPKLSGDGPFHVTAKYQGKTYTAEIVVDKKWSLILSEQITALPGMNLDRDNKLSSGEGIQTQVDRCVIPDWYVAAHGENLEKWRHYFSPCVRYNAGSLDTQFSFHTSDPSVLAYEGNGVFRARRAGKVRVWVEEGGDVSNAMEYEVWEPVPDLNTCGGGAPNRAEWSGGGSVARIETDCYNYARGAPVTVRWTAQVEETVSRSRVNVCLDLAITDCDGNVVRTLRRENCERFAARATITDTMETVYDTSEIWDANDDSGNSVPPGCYKAWSRFNILYEPEVAVKFTVQ
jgi:hypothetical protein